MTSATIQLAISDAEALRIIYALFAEAKGHMTLAMRARNQSERLAHTEARGECVAIISRIEEQYAVPPKPARDDRRHERGEHFLQPGETCWLCGTIRLDRTQIAREE